MWMIIISLTTAPIPGLSEAYAHSRFPTRAACLSAAAERTVSLTAIDVHGRYLCMVHREPDRLLAREPQGVF